MNFSNALWAWSAVTLACAVSCTSGGPRASIGEDCDGSFCTPVTPSFEAPEAGAGLDPVTGPMCPVTTCTQPWATCPSSKYPCDVDLSNDSDNCGGCGIRCDDRGVAMSEWRCVAGQCALVCFSDMLDCDGDPTNGCEALAMWDDHNCGGCGVECRAGMHCYLAECVGECAEANAPDVCDGACTDVGRDDNNCGTCGNVCDPTGPDRSPLPADMYYGCVGGSCGHERCAIENMADCNQDPSDGCEAALHTNENCNGCGDTCPPGKQCRSVSDNRYACLCEVDGETLCVGLDSSDIYCARLDDDPDNCGGCHRICPGRYQPHFSATCARGVCGGACADGYADCDGVSDNGCEVDTRVDNRHCGACGNACLPDQVCSAGKCLVAPCDAGSPEGPTK